MIRKELKNNEMMDREKLKVQFIFQLALRFIVRGNSVELISPHWGQTSSQRVQSKK